MKRFAAHIGLISFSVFAVAFYMSETVVLIAMIASAVLSGIFLLIKKTRSAAVLPVAAAVAALAFGINLAYTDIAVKPVIGRYCGEDKQIEATLTDEAYQQYTKYYYRLETDTIDGETAHLKILLKSNRRLMLEPFDTISFSADVYPTDNDYYRAKGYYITVDEYDISYTTRQSDQRTLYYHAIRLRQSLREALDEYLPEDEANLCKAVLLGDKYALDEKIRQEFRIAGASYFIVVSGMHFSILCWMCFRIFKKLFRKRIIYFPLTYLVIFLYMMVTGFQPSVMRSGVMMLILVTGKLIRRQGDALNSIGIAGLVMPFVFTPYGCGDIGMILSFAATFSIIMWQEPIFEKIRIKKVGKNIIKKGVNAILSILSVSLAANILVFPLSVFLFNGFSTVTLLSALLLYPLIWLMIALSLFVCLMYLLGPLRYVALMTAWPLYGVSKLILWSIGLLSSFPYAYIHVRSLYFYIWVGVSFVLGLFAYFLRKRFRLYPIALLLSAILFFGGMTINTVVQINTDVLEYDAGESGAAVWLNRGGRIHLLRFDCDSRSAYRMLYEFIDSYAGAYSGFTRSYCESVNYDRMTYDEFPVEHYFVYDKYGKYLSDGSTAELFDGSIVIALDEGLELYTVEDNDKILLYLRDRDKRIMLIPDRFPYDAIPSKMRDADVIVLGKTAEDYDRLRCDTLIVCGSAEDTPDLPQCEKLVDSSDQRVSIDMN